MNDWMNEWMNEWMSEWMNEWMNDWMNEWMNGWTNERMEESLGIEGKRWGSCACEHTLAHFQAQLMITFSSGLSSIRTMPVNWHGVGVAARDVSWLPPDFKRHPCTHWMGLDQHTSAHFRIPNREGAQRYLPVNLHTSNQKPALRVHACSSSHHLKTSMFKMCRSKSSLRTHTNNKKSHEVTKR